MVNVAMVSASAFWSSENVWYTEDDGCTLVFALCTVMLKLRVVCSGETVSWVSPRFQTGIVIFWSGCTMLNFLDVPWDLRIMMNRMNTKTILYSLD